MRLQQFGLGVDLPRGWEGQIYRRPTGEVEVQGGKQATSHPVLHAASFGLPRERGDFGSGAVELMTNRDVFIALVEYHPDAARTALFRRRGAPRALRPSAFSPNKLQRALPGQAGTQVFFSERGRAYCLYVVLGSDAARNRLVARANEVLAALQIENGTAVESDTEGPS